MLRISNNKAHEGGKMQKYLSPALRYFSRMLPHGSEMKMFVGRHRMLVFTAVATLVVILLTGLITARGIMNTPHQNAFTHETHATGSSITTTVTNGPSAINGMQVPDSKTHVTVNNQQVDVPANGSVSKTLTNDNGTKTHIDVSHSSSSTGDGSVSSTSVSAQSSSQSIIIHHSP